MSSPLEYARAGVPIVPLKVSFENGRWRKRPHIKSGRRARPRMKRRSRRGGVRGRRRTLACRWSLSTSSSLMPIGMAGPDGVAALSAIDLPPHQAVVTMSNGEHHFFRQPAPRIRFAAFEGIQVLGDGRLVVAYAVAPFVSPRQCCRAIC